MVRFSKTIQRAIPQKIRRSASMLQCETTPFCYTPKYATIVLRSSGALKHWLVSSVASLGGLARVRAPWRKYATIVLRSSGALKHWLVSSVASLGGLARVGAPWRPAELPT